MLDSDLIIFYSLSPTGKRVCDSNVLAYEEKLEEQLQTIFFETLDNADTRNSAIAVHMSSLSQLSCLQREFVHYYNGSKPLHDETEIQNVMNQYRIKILVPSIRLYYKRGAKGGASVESLIKSDILSCMTGDSLNPASRIVSLSGYFIVSRLRDVK